MKRNFLLMLLLTLLPFVGWAQGLYVTVQAGGGYTAQFHQTETYVFAGKGLPKVDNILLSGEPVSGTISPALDGTYKVVQKVGETIQTVESVNAHFNPLTVGNYYLEFTITGTNTVKTVYVPFQVGQEFTNYEFIWNEATFEQSCEDGALRMYYDTYYPTGCEEDGNWEKAASVNDSKYVNHEGFPWIAFKAPTTGSYKVMFTYDNDEGLDGLNNPCMPWYEKTVQTFGNGTNDRKFGLASVVERTSFNHFDWQIGVDPTATNNLVGPNPNPDGPEDDAFKLSEFHMYWMPAENITDITIDPATTTLTDISDYTWALPVITFNGTEQKLDALFTAGTAKVQADASSTTPLVFGTDFTATYVADADYRNAGEGKSVTITGIGKYKGSFTKTYTINPFALDASNFSLNPAGPTFQYDGTNQAPAVEGTGVTPPATIENPEPTAVVLGANDFTTKLYKSSGGSTAPQGVSEAREAGNYFYAITPKGNYKAAEVDGDPVVIALEFTVEGLDLSRDAVVTMPQVGYPAANGYVYNTKEQKPVFTTTSTATADATVKYNNGTEDVTLVEGTDFEVVPPLLGADYTNVGEKEITIAFKGSYTGQKVVSYNIFAKDINTIEQTTFNAPTYNPTGVAQIGADNFDFKYNNVSLVLGSESEGDFTWNWKDGSDGESAGEQIIVVSGRGNYKGTTEVSFNLKPYAVTITPAKAEKEYGKPDPAPNFTIDSNSASKIEYGDEEWQYIQSFLVMERNTNDANNSDELRESNVEGGHKYAIRLKDTEEPCNYEILIQNNDGILFINPAPLTVKVAKNSKTYGDADPNFTEDKDANNKFQILYGGNDVTNAKDFADDTKNLKEVLNIGRKPGEDVKDSPYDFTWDNDNYKVTFEPVGFTINPKQVTIDVAFDGNGYEYKGEEWNPIPKVTIKGTETELANPKDFAVTWAPGTGANDLINATEGSNVANNKWPSGTVSQVTKGNYTFSPVQAYFKITQATLEIEAISDNKKAYTGIEGTDPTPLAMLTFAQGKGPKGRDKYENGECNFIVSGTNTPIFYKNGNKNAAAPLIIREKGEHTGDYEISINPDVRTRNYNIVSTATANFLIYRTDEIVISFDSPKEITYLDELDLKSLIVITAPTGVNTADLKNYLDQNVKKYQFINPETGEVDNANGEKTYIETNNVGTYHLTINDVPTAYKNYDVRLTEGILKINHFPLYIIANDQKEYGDEEPTTYAWDVYEYKKVGDVWKYVKTDKTDFEVPEENLIGNTGNWFDDIYRYTISRTRENGGENVGHYTTTIRNIRNRRTAWGTKSYDTQYDGNYSFTFAQGDFEITRRALTVAVEGASKFYGEYDPVKVDNEWVLSADLDENEDDNVSVFTKGLVKITITNALPRDLEMIAGKVTFTHRDAGEVVKAGGYQVKNVNFDGVSQPGATRLANYTLSYSNNANFMINKRVLKVIAHDQSVPYANPLVIAPYDLTITEGILLDNVYKTFTPDGKAILYDANVTTMPQANATDSKAINDRVDQVFKPLEVAEDCPTNVGEYHKNAFKLELTAFGDQNYKLEFTNGKLFIEQATELWLDMANLAQALNDHKGRKVTVKLIGAPVKEEGCDPFRQFVAYQWNTLVLPFRALPRDIVAPFRYGAIDVLDESNSNEGSFRLGVTTRAIEANTPFLIQTDKSLPFEPKASDAPYVLDNVKWENVEIADFDYLNEDPTATDAAGNKFVGTYKPKSNFTDANYIMRANTGEFFRFIAGADGVAPSYAMKQTEAYLEAVNPAAGVRIFIDEEDGSTTAIDFVEGETKPINAEGAFNLSGQRVSKAQKGILIIDGKKVLVK